MFTLWLFLRQNLMSHSRRSIQIASLHGLDCYSNDGSIMAFVREDILVKLISTEVYFSI